MATLMNMRSDDSPADEAALAREACVNAQAFAELYYRYANNIFRYQMAHTGNRRDAEDLTSQTFMAALEGIHTYRGRGTFAAWLMGIASRKRALFFRRRRPEIPIEAARSTSTWEPAAEKTAFHHIQFESIVRALRQLSPDRAEAIVLSFFGGLTNSETGRVLGKTEAAVKMLLSRGLRDLRERTSLTPEVER